MITQILKRRVASESVIPQVCQGVVLLIAAIVFVAGFRRIAQLELAEEQLLLGFGIDFSLVLQCGILWVLMELARKRKAA